MPDGSMFPAFLAATLVTVAVPGPSVVFLVARSIELGRSAGLRSMLGLETGALIHVAAAAAGLTALVAASDTALLVLRYGGAAYLLHLGVSRLVARPVPVAAGPVERTTRGLFRDGVLVDLLNPKTALFFLAFLPQFVDPGAGPAAAQVCVLGLCFVTVAVLFDGSYVLLAGRLRERVRRSAAGGRGFDRLTGGVYLALAGAAVVV